MTNNTIEQLILRLETRLSKLCCCDEMYAYYSKDRDLLREIKKQLGITTPAMDHESRYPKAFADVEPKCEKYSTEQEYQQTLDFIRKHRKQ